MANQQPPKIEFPCLYPIKVMGEASPDFTRSVFDCIKKHAPELQSQHMRVKNSKQARYQSVTVTITATGTNQLSAIFNDLKRNRGVKLVL